MVPLLILIGSLVCHSSSAGEPELDVNLSRNEVQLLEPFIAKVKFKNITQTEYHFQEWLCSWWTNWTIRGEGSDIFEVYHSPYEECTKNYPTEVVLKPSESLERNVFLRSTKNAPVGSHSFYLTHSGPHTLVGPNKNKPMTVESSKELKVTIKSGQKYVLSRYDRLVDYRPDKRPTK